MSVLNVIVLKKVSFDTKEVSYYCRMDPSTYEGGVASKGIWDLVPHSNNVFCGKNYTSIKEFVKDIQKGVTNFEHMRQLCFKFWYKDTKPEIFAFFTKKEESNEFHCRGQLLSEETQLSSEEQLEFKLALASL